MIVEPAPSFGAAGLFLSAPYTVDFTKDLAHTIPIDGTWQGDRKSGKSLYIDNYSNNVSITVSSGNYSIRIPAYTSAYVDLTGFNDVLLTADAGAVNNVRLSTEPKKTEMISRGNSPANNAVLPFNFAGSANLTTATGAGAASLVSANSYNGPIMIYCPLNSCMYIYATNGNVVVFDCVSNKIKTAFVPASGYVPKSCLFYGGKIYFGLNTGYVVMINPVDNSCLFKKVGPSSNDIRSMCVHEVEQRLYVSASSDSIYSIAVDLTGTAIKVVYNGGATTLGYTRLAYSTKDKAIYAIWSSTLGSGLQYSAAKISLDIISNPHYCDWSQAVCTASSPAAIWFDGIDNFYVASCYAGTSVYPVYNLKLSDPNSAQTAGTNASNACIDLIVSPVTNYLYVPDTKDVYDPLLKGIVGTMPKGGVSAYYPANDYVYVLSSDGLLQWGK